VRGWFVGERVAARGLAALFDLIDEDCCRFVPKKRRPGFVPWESRSDAWQALEQGTSGPHRGDDRRTRVDDPQSSADLRTMP
jgi:hypothetical protein